MTEREQLIQAKEQLKSSVSTAWSDLKNYGKAIMNQTGATFSQTKNTIVDFTNTQIANYYLRQEEKAQEKEVKAQEKEEQRQQKIEEKERIRERKKDIKIAFRNYEREQRQEKMLKFKEGVKQKTTTIFGKLGKIKNSFIEKLRPSNLDLKLRNAMDQVQIAGLTVANKTKEIYNTAKENVTDFTNTQIANYYLRQEEKAQEKEVKAQEKEEQRQQKIEEKERIRERKKDIKIAFRNYEREQRQEKMLKFKEGVKQKTTTVFGKLGKIKNSFIEKLRPSNLDLKLRNAMDQVQIAGLTVANKTKEIYNTAKENVTDFTNTQIANYYLRQEEKAQERIKKDFERAARLAEKEEIQKQRERIRARKKDIIAAFSNKEREEYEQKLEANEARKQELRDSLYGEREEQFGEMIVARAR